MPTVPAEKKQLKPPLKRKLLRKRKPPPKERKKVNRHRMEYMNVYENLTFVPRRISLE
jgi:hypothetical protein